MDKYIIHAATQRQFDDFVASPSHAVILSGPTGSGKLTLAGELVQTVLEIESFNDYPYGLVVSPTDGKSIGVEAVRELEHFLSLKVPSKKAINRFVIFEDGHTLTIEAQNALLKTLEEPPQGSLIVLTSANEEDLLPTIRSRAQTLSVLRPERTQVEDFYKNQGHDEAAVRQASAVSGGLPGLMQAVLTGEEHPLKHATDYARQLLTKSQYERLLMVDELAKQKNLAKDVLFILQQMAHVSLQKAEGKAAEKWQSVLEASYNASESLSVSAQPKLALTNLMLHL